MDSLAALVGRNGPLDPTDAAGWAVRLAKRVEELHRLGVAHGAISAECVRAAEGSSQARGVLVDVRNSPVLPPYHSPDRLAGGGISLLDDTWAVLVTLHFLASGALPFEGATAAAVASNIASGNRGRFQRGGAGAEALEQLVGSYLGADGAARTLTLTALRQQLERLIPGADKVGALPPLEEERSNLGDTFESSPGAELDDDDDDDEDAATVMRDFTDVRAQLRRGELPRPPSSSPPGGGSGPGGAGSLPRTQQLPAMPAPRPAAGAPAIPRPQGPPRTQPLPVVPSATAATAVRPHPSAGPPQGPALPGAVPRVVARAGTDELEERTLNVAGGAYRPGTRPIPQVPADRVPTPGPGPTSAVPLPGRPPPPLPGDAAPPLPGVAAPRLAGGAPPAGQDIEDDDDDDAALATMVMAGLDASELSAEVEAQLAARGIGADGSPRLGAGQPVATPRPAAGWPAAPSGPGFSAAGSAAGRTEPGGPGVLPDPPAGSLFVSEPTVDEPMTQALVQQSDSVFDGRPGAWPAPGLGSGPPGQGVSPLPQPAAAAGAAGDSRYPGGSPGLYGGNQTSQAAPWASAAPAPVGFELPDPEELEALAAQDRRLKRLLGIAIVVLIVVLTAVVMLWLRRMGMVAF